MKCSVCRRRLRKTWSIHHIYWPKNKATRAERRVTVKLHKDCHEQYHWYFLKNCVVNIQPCKWCRFTTICCYYDHKV